ncbi:MAG: hypothetical protein ACREQT_12185 [Candidatus Binataceae bacterium]
MSISISALRQLAITYAKVQDTFANLVDGFNAGPAKPDWAKLRNVLDEKVVVIGIDHHTQVASGKAKVLALLSRQDATFTTTSQPVAPVVNNKAAYIGGTAAWHDNDGDPDGEVQFVFGFVNRGTARKPNWLAVRLFATRD